MSDAPPLDPAVLARIRAAAAVVLGGLALGSAAVAVAGVWPVPWLDEVAVDRFGVTTWRLRFVGVFCVLGGGFVLPALIVLAVVVNVARALRR